MVDAVELIANPLMPKRFCDEQPAPAEIVQGLGSGEGFAEAMADREWWPEGTSPPEDDPEVLTGRRALFLINETGALLEKDARGQAGAMLDFLLNVFDAHATWTHRTRSGRDKKGVLTITNGIGVVLGASTWAWITATLSDTQVMSGLANRFLWFAGPSARMIAIRPRIPPDQIAELQHRVREVLDAVRGKSAILTREAEDAHAAYYVAERSVMADSEIADAAVARSDILALRLAMLNAVADGTVTLGSDHIHAAWAVVRYSQNVVMDVVARIHERTMRDTEARLLAAARRVAEESGGVFTKRSVRQRVKGCTGMDAETFNRCWDALVKAADIVPIIATNTFTLGAP